MTTPVVTSPFQVGDWVRVTEQTSDHWTPQEGTEDYPQPKTVKPNHYTKHVHSGKVELVGELGQLKHIVTFPPEEGEEESSVPPSYLVRFSYGFQKICPQDWWMFRENELEIATPTEAEQWAYVESFLDYDEEGDDER